MRTLIEASLIVMLVIFLFLGSLRVVAIPIVAIPLSLITVLFLIWVMGFSINLLTLLAMVIAIGLVVDDAIVVVENVHRHIEAGKQPLDAALPGAREVAMPVIAMTLTLVAVYLPIGFLGGLTGVLFSEFALTLAGAVVVSGVIALVLSPMMCAYLLKDHEHQGHVASWLDARFQTLHRRYESWLAHCLDNRGAVMLFGVRGARRACRCFYQLAQRELAPEEDSGGIFAMATPPDYGSLEYTTYFLDQMVAAWKTVPEVAHSWQVNEPTSVFGGLQLKPWSERERSLEEIRQEIQQQVRRHQRPGDLHVCRRRIAGCVGGLPVQFVISGNVGYRGARPRRRRGARQGATVRRVRVRQQRPALLAAGSRREHRPRARGAPRHLDGGHRPDLADHAGRGGNEPLQPRRAQLQGDPAGRPRLSPDQGVAGTLLPAHRERHAGAAVHRDHADAGGEAQHVEAVPAAEQRDDRGLMMPPNSLGDGLAFLDDALHEVAPTGYRVDYAGESRRFMQESQSFLLLFASSLVFIFLVLSAQFNSFRDPLIVLVSVPLSIFGALVPLALGMTTLNIYTQIGLLTLIGLISKHGILIVDFANNRLREGRTGARRCWKRRGCGCGRS